MGKEAKIIQFPQPKYLTPEQRLSWQQDAAYWERMEEYARAHMEDAQQRRQYALRMLGMLGTK